MNKIIYLVVVIFLCGKLSAQTDTLRLSLNQAMQLGLSNRFDLKENRLNINIAENRQIKAQKELIPDLSVDGKLTYNGKLEPTIIPAGLLGFTEAGKVYLGVKNNTAFSLDINYTVFKPGLYTDINIAANAIQIEKEKNNKYNADIKEEIAKAYDDVLLKTLQCEIAKKDELRYKDYYDLASGKYGNGALLECDMLQSDLDYKNAVANSEKQKQNQLLSVQYLKYKINIPSQSILVLTDSLKQYAEAIKNYNTATATSQKRSEIKLLEMRQVGYELELRKAKQNYLPTFSLFASYSYLYQGANFNYSNGFFWDPVNSIGAKLSIPITGIVKNINTVEEYNMELAKNDLNLKQTTSDIQYEIEEARTRLDNARINLSTATENYVLSQKVYELKKLQFGAGSFSYDELLNTEKSLNTTEQEYITAVYNFLIADINYHKALGDY